MKTIVIFNDVDKDIEFFVLEGDQSHLDGAYINCNKLGKELLSIMYSYQGDLEVLMLKKFPMLNEPFIVIVAGQE